MPRNLIRVFLSFCLLALLAAGCGGKTSNGGKQGATPAPAETTSTAADAAKVAAGTSHAASKGKVRYTCTMDPEVISDKPGNCPKCGMELVVKK